MKRRSFLKAAAATLGLAVLPGTKLLEARPVLPAKSPWLGSKQPIDPCLPERDGTFIPEIWAREGLAILEENMVVSKLMHRDFGDACRYSFGDIVNTDRFHREPLPSEMRSYREPLPSEIGSYG